MLLRLLRFVEGVGWRLINGLTKTAPVQAISTIIGTIIQWAYLSMMSVTAPIARWFALTLTKVWMKDAKQWADFVSEAIKHITGWEIPPEKIIEAKTVEGQVEIQRAFARAYLDHILHLILPKPPMTAEKGLEGAERFLSVNLGFQMSGWLLHLLGVIYSFGKFKSIKDLPNAISWSFGIGWLSWLVMGTPFRIGISDPLERYYNRYFKPQELTMEQLIKLYQLGLIETEELYKRAEEHGFNYERVTERLALAERQMTLSDLKTYARYYKIEPEAIVARLKRMGYPDDLAITLKNIILDERLNDLKDDLAKQAIRLYEQDAITDAELRTYLTATRWTPEEIDLQREVSSLKKIPVRRLSLSRILKAWKQGILVREQAYDRIVKLGYTPEDAEVILRTEEEE